MRFLKIIAVFLFSATFLGSCFNVPDYPDAPEIEFADIASILRVDELTGGYKDSVVISVKFRDGDGDLGYVQREIDSLARAGGGQNFLVRQFRRVNGRYVAYEPLESQSGYFHRLSGDKPGPIEGTIHYSGIQVYHSFYPYAKDTVKFEIYIRDRAGNISNTIMTDSVVLRLI
ncbi:MAG: hypothetical protein LRY55_10755 [Leadbetterella sp.]|nr:hypothetical protein [Leadbetterella sp.]